MLEPGTRLGTYTIIAALGEGGMGAVYRARDAALNRDVAIKVLRSDVSADPDRLARFTREAQVLASLNHPNIAAIYGLTEAAGAQALVLELVEGPTLADRIAAGAIPLEESLVIARQMVEALDAAHAQGIVHRDLKPANIKLRPDGTVKVLDFGLAKAADPAVSASIDPTSSPTITSQRTVAGLILGTAAYMSPEQASGKPVDKRADVWAFGVVLFEMLTGRRLFNGETVSHVLAAVLTEQPQFADVPPHVRPLLTRCLERDPKKRLRDIGDAMALVPDVAPQAVARSHLGSTGWLAAAALLLAVGVLAVPYFRSAPDPPVMRFEIPAPPDAVFNVRPGMFMEISPDGRHLAFVATVAGRRPQLFIRAMDGIEARPVSGTAQNSRPFWSPDSRFVGFFSEGQLKKVDVTGGTPQPLCAVPEGNGVSGAWGPNGILFTSNSTSGLMRISPDGGTPAQVTTPAARETRHEALKFLPDGRHYLLAAYGKTPGSSVVSVASMDSTARTPLVATNDKSGFVAPDRFFFVRDNALLVQTLNMRTFALEGEPSRLLDRVMTGPIGSQGLAGFSVSENGLLIFVEGMPDGDAELTWYDRAGRVLSRVGTAPYQGVDLSRDGTRVAAHNHGEGVSGGDIWIIDLGRANTSTRLTFDESQDNSSPIWSPDGASIAFSSFRNGRYGIYRKAANGVGSEELLFESETSKTPTSWAPDGQSIVFVNYDPKTEADLWILPLTGDRRPTPYQRAPGSEIHGQISPNGRWIAYTLDGDVWVQSYPVPGTKYRAVASAALPRWRADGEELFTSSRQAGRTWSVSVSAHGPALTLGAPQLLFDRRFYSRPHLGPSNANTNYHTYAVSPDGQRILAPRQPAVDTPRPSLTVIVNWMSLLKESLPGDH